MKFIHDAGQEVIPTDSPRSGCAGMLAEMVHWNLHVDAAASEQVSG